MQSKSETIKRENNVKQRLIFGYKAPSPPHATSKHVPSFLHALLYPFFFVNFTFTASKSQLQFCPEWNPRLEKKIILNIKLRKWKRKNKKRTKSTGPRVIICHVINQRVKYCQIPRRCREDASNKGIYKSNLMGVKRLNRPRFRSSL